MMGRQPIFGMQEQGEFESDHEIISLPVGSRSYWISIHYEEQGTKRTHDFSTVQELAQFLRQRPDLGRMFGYIRKG